MKVHRQSGDVGSAAPRGPGPRQHGGGLSRMEVQQRVITEYLVHAGQDNFISSAPEMTVRR